jgi:hypothetical protein
VTVLHLFDAAPAGMRSGACKLRRFSLSSVNRQPHSASRRLLMKPATSTSPRCDEDLMDTVVGKNVAQYITRVNTSQLEMKLKAMERRHPGIKFHTAKQY